MTEIYLVRHGQARFGSGDYDRLSDLGRLQCEHLGRHWQRLGQRFDAAYAGPLRRQQHSCQISLPGHLPELAEPLREYDADGLIAAYARRLRGSAAEGNLAVSLGYNSGPGHYRSVLAEALAAWSQGEPPADGTVESWDAFIARTGDFLTALAQRHRDGERVAVFTSGGVIAAALCATLQLSPQAAVAMSWHLRNASVTRLHHQDDHWSMVCYNETGHLQHPDRPELLTLL